MATWGPSEWDGMGSITWTLWSIQKTTNQCKAILNPTLSSSWQNRMSSRETEMGLTFPQMILLLNLVVSVKSQSLYSADPNLELISISRVGAQNHLLLIYVSSSQSEQTGTRSWTPSKFMLILKVLVPRSSSSLVGETSLNPTPAVCQNYRESYSSSNLYVDGWLDWWRASHPWRYSSRGGKVMCQVDCGEEFWREKVVGIHKFSCNSESQPLIKLDIDNLVGKKFTIIHA